MPTFIPYWKAAVEKLFFQGDFKSQREAAWALTNLTSGGSTEQILSLCEQGVLKPLCDLLTARDERLLMVVLDGITNILSAGNKIGQLETVSLAVEECEGLEKIESLQNHENETIYHKALNIVTTFFPEDNEVKGGTVIS